MAEERLGPLDGLDELLGDCKTKEVALLRDGRRNRIGSGSRAALSFRRKIEPSANPSCLRPYSQIDGYPNASYSRRASNSPSSRKNSRSGTRSAFSSSFILSERAAIAALDSIIITEYVLSWR